MFIVSFNTSQKTDLGNIVKQTEMVSAQCDLYGNVRLSNIIPNIANKIPVFVATNTNNVAFSFCGTNVLYVYNFVNNTKHTGTVNLKVYYIEI